MTRMIRGSVLLAACVGLWSCSSDPTADEAGVPFRVVAVPSVMIVNAGASQLIGFQLVDELNGQIPTTWSIGATPAGFNVAIDSNFRPVYNPDGTLTLPAEQTEIRATISGLIPSSGEFIVTASGKSITVPVTVVHPDLPATFNTTQPNVGQQLVLTMPADLSLNPDATFTAGDSPDPIVVSQAVDGSSAVLLVAPGTSSQLTVSGITPSYAPSVNLTLETTDTIIATDASDYTGTDDPVTAPTIPLAPVGETVTIYDIPSAVDMFYKIVLTETTTIKVDTDWADHAGDVDQLYLNSAFALIPPFTAATGAAPETSTATLAAGTYYIYLNQYDGDPGDWYLLSITTVSQP